MIYNYNAKDYEGQYHKGEIEAANEKEAAAILRRRKLIVLSIKTPNQFQEEFWERYLDKISFNEIVVMTRQLSTMVSSGLVLSEALDILTEEQQNKRFKKVLSSISNDVKGGLDFATSLEKHPDVFPPIYSKLIRAGQISGKLDVILLQLATNLEKERLFRSRVRGALIYPVIVVCLMVLVSLVMVFYVVPKLTSLYQESGIDLPLPTKILVSITTFGSSYWWLILMLILIVVVMFRRYQNSPEGKLVLDQLVLKIPVVQKIVNLVILTNFTRTFALLTASGISILDSIQIVSGITDNLAYKNALDISYKGVERGLTLSDQLLNLQVFPQIVGQMVKTGEETGKLDEILFKLSDYFESEADESLKNITTIIEPIVIVILGVGVMFLLISVIMPIYQLTTNIR